MRRFCLVIFFLLVLTFNPILARVQKDSCITLSKNTFFVELLGAGYNGSINYDRIFYQKSNVKFSYSVGFFTVPVFVSIDWNRAGNFIPLSINIIKGNKNHFLETGFWLTTIYDDYSTKDIALNKDTYTYNYWYQMIFGLKAGYRYQKLNGLFCRFTFNPIFYSLDKQYSNSEYYYILSEAQQVNIINKNKNEGFVFFPLWGIALGKSF